jgi:hypothetical protein
LPLTQLLHRQTINLLIYRRNRQRGKPSPRLGKHLPAKKDALFSLAGSVALVVRHQSIPLMARIPGTTAFLTGLSPAI